MSLRTENMRVWIYLARLRKQERTCVNTVANCSIQLKKETNF